MTRTCEICGAALVRPKKASEKQWLSKRFCSNPCKSRAPRKSLAERFWSKVSKGKKTQCWPWTGALDGHGYGQMSVHGARSPQKAYRVSWELHFGAVPAGLVVRHKCDNPNCVNPGHLELGTQRDNVLDRVNRGRTNPRSLLNLRPGAPGHHGAGPHSVKEINDGVAE